MVKFKIEWSVEARLDLIDILEFYIKQNDSATYSYFFVRLIPTFLHQIHRNPNKQGQNNEINRGI